MCESLRTLPFLSLHPQWGPHSEREPMQVFPMHYGLHVKTPGPDPANRCNLLRHLASWPPECIPASLSPVPNLRWGSGERLARRHSGGQKAKCLSKFASVGRIRPWSFSHKCSSLRLSGFAGVPVGRRWEGTPGKSRGDAEKGGGTEHRLHYTPRQTYSNQNSS